MELRKGTKEDAQAFVDLIQKVREGMTHPEWFYLDPPEETKRKISASQLQLWVAMDGSTMAGAFSVLFPGLEGENYGYDLELPREELMHVVNMDTAAVHPDNHHSLQNVLDQGYTIQAKRSKYGSVRYLLRKDIP